MWAYNAEKLTIWKCSTKSYLSCSFVKCIFSDTVYVWKSILKIQLQIPANWKVINILNMFYNTKSLFLNFFMDNILCIQVYSFENLHKLANVNTFNSNTVLATTFCYFGYQEAKILDISKCNIQQSIKLSQRLRSCASVHSPNV